MQVGIGYSIKNHRKIAIYIGSRGTPVMVGMFNIVGADLQPALGKFNGILHVRGACYGTAPDGADRSTHHDARIGTLFNAAFGFGPIVRQGCTGIGKVMFLLG